MQQLESCKIREPLVHFFYIMSCSASVKPLIFYMLLTHGGRVTRRGMHTFQCRIRELTLLSASQAHVKRALFHAGRIFEFVHGPAVVNMQALPAVVGALLAAIRDEPHIAEKVCR